MKINTYIDHTLLKPEASREQIIKLCHEAKTHQFAAVCVNATYVSLAKKELIGTDVKVCTVVGFPLGASPKEVKALEADIAINDGAKEIDMVLNIGALMDGDYATVLDDIKYVTQICHQKQAIVKVIFETCLLNTDQIKKACELCVEAKADYVKTSTGFSTSGATFEVVELMKQTVGEKAKVKAAGGVKTPEDAHKMIELGASRIGTSSGVKLVN